jgi:hypothetical protein
LASSLASRISSMTMHGAIETRISEFLAADDPKLKWVKSAVREHAFLPLYIGWVATLGLRPDGTFIRWDHEDDRASVKQVTDAFWQRMAICQGAKRYPELRALLPERPATAQTCAACRGSGQVSGIPHVICECGGIGWIISGEQRESSPG